MPGLTLSLLGPFQASFDGRPITAFESDKARALLAYLAVESDRPHSRQKLAGLLWPDSAEAAARANLSHALNNLRHLLGDRDAEPPLLLVSRREIQFNRRGDAFVDVLAFLDQSGLRDLAGLEQAAALYRDRFLEGFSLSGCADFEEWLLLEQEQLHRRAMEVLARLAAVYEEQDELKRALAFARRQLELDSWWESAHQAAMRLLALTGQRDAALAQYRACRRLLADGLGAEPSAETLDLYRQIRDDTLSRPEAQPVHPAAPPAPAHNLPAPLTPFVGRKKELAAVADRLCDPACRLLTLLGPGGVGKTRLALEAARAHLHDYRDGVFQVRLVGVGSVAGILPAVAGALGLATLSVGNLRDRLLEHLRDRQMLILLDNYEHLLDGVQEVVEILRAAPGVRVLVTSRERLNLMGEHLLPVAGLSVPPTFHAGGLHHPAPPGPRDLAEYDAVALFMTGAQRIRPDFRLEGHAADVARICQMVEGFPLALLLASGWVEMLSPGEIARRLEEGLDLLAADWPDLAERHRSMRATWDHSWRLLAGQERAALAALTVFRGGFRPAAAEAVAGVFPADLQRLVGKSLVQRLPDGRFELHELLRQFAAEKLAAEPSAWHGSHDRHSAYYATSLETWGVELWRPNQEAVLAEMDVELDNARAAWDWAVEQRHLERLERSLEGLCRYYKWRGRSLELASACQAAATMLSNAIPDDPVLDSARSSLPIDRALRLWVLLIHWLLNVRQEAKLDGPALAQQGLALLERPELAGQDTRVERAWLLAAAALVYWNSVPQEAFRLLHESLDLYRAAGRGTGPEAACALIDLAAAYWRAGRYSEDPEFGLESGWRLGQESLTLLQEIGSLRSAWLAVWLLGSIALAQGRRAEGMALLRRFIAAFKATSERANLRFRLPETIFNLVFRARFTEARILSEEAAQTFQEIEDLRGLVGTRQAQGVADLLTGRYDAASVRFQDALTLAQEYDDRFAVAVSMAHLGEVQLGLKRTAEAYQVLSEARTCLVPLHEPWILEQCSAFLACAALGLGRAAEAERHLRVALASAHREPHFTQIVFALPALARLLLARGEVAGAVELQALALRYPVPSRAQFFEDIGWHHIETAAADLPPDVVATAQERGRARDLYETASEFLAELEARAPSTLPER